jgi:urease accessory protein
LLFEQEIEGEQPVMADPPLQRSHGIVRVGFARDGSGRTMLKQLHQAGSAKVRFPNVHQGPPLGVLINTSGGVTGGDVFEYAVSVGAGGQATITTQACEKVYRAAGLSPAEIFATVAVADNARLLWLPQETIMFDGGRLSRRLDIDLSGSAEFVGVESYLLGRRAMGESMATGSLHDRWSVRRDKRLIFADALKLSGDIGAQIAGPALLAGCTAFSTLVYFGPEPERYLQPLREALGPSGGASAFEGKLIARLACADGLTLRARLVKALAILMDGQCLPPVWHV